jgi:hypothetical protein
MRLKYVPLLATSILVGLAQMAVGQPPSEVSTHGPAVPSPTLGAPQPANQAASVQNQLQLQQQEIKSLTETAQSLQALQADQNVPATLPTSGDLNLQQTGLALAQDGKQTPEQMQKQLELQRQQIEVLNKMIRLLAKQLEQQGPTVNKLEGQMATLEARSLQAAARDQQLAGAIDNIVEHQDALERYGPQLPAPLRELFLPSGTNETPLSIYGALAFGYSHILGDSTSANNGAGRPSTPGGFYFGEFTPDFLLKLNDWIFLEAEIGIGADGSVSAGSFAQADFFITDWLTVVAGRFVAPIGWFNERLNNPWINKLPGDAPGSGPLLWQQVLPPVALLGVMAQGAFYLCGSPLKMEYNAYVSNGLNLTPATPGSPTLSELANLENMTNTFSFNTNQKAIGGRLGLWWPQKGLAGGVSGLCNGDYLGGFEDSIALWAVDLNYHRGNWDVRLEYGMTCQHAQSFQPDNIRRNGFYGQVAYRPWDLPPGILQQLEFVYRYSYVDFHGIDPNALDLTTFSTPIDVPIRRQQNEFGINYYFYPRMVLKVAYQINDEPNHHLHDNQFITELAWGW